MTIFTCFLLQSIPRNRTITYTFMFLIMSQFLCVRNKYVRKFVTIVDQIPLNAVSCHQTGCVVLITVKCPQCAQEFRFSTNHQRRSAFQTNLLISSAILFTGCVFSQITKWVIFYLCITECICKIIITFHLSGSVHISYIKYILYNMVYMGAFLGSWLAVLVSAL